MSWASRDTSRKSFVDVHQDGANPTIDNARDAVRAFVARYNAEWLIEKNGQRSPADMCAAWQQETFRRAA